MSKFDRACSALKAAQRDAEKEATRLEITQPALSQEARERADGLADALQVINSLADLQEVIARLSA